MERIFDTKKGNRYYISINERLFEILNSDFFTLSELDKRKTEARFLHQIVKHCIEGCHIEIDSQLLIDYVILKPISEKIVKNSLDSVIPFYFPTGIYYNGKYKS